MKKNPSVINQDVQKYVNDIIKSVYKIKSFAIKHFNSDLSSSSSVNGSTFIETNIEDSRFGMGANIAGLSYRDIYLLKNYLKKFKQTKIEQYWKIPLNSTEVIATYTTSNIVSVTEGNDITTISIKVPDGYDGNTSFVQVLIDDVGDEPLDGESPSDHDYIAPILDAQVDTGTKRDSMDALLYNAPKLRDGSWGIEIGKQTRAIDITVNSSGIMDAVDYTLPNLIVKITYFKRGIK